MDTTLAVAGIQMQVYDGHDQRDRMEKLTAETIDNFPWVDLLLFSELCVFGAAPRTAETIPGPTSDRFCDLAAKHGKWLVPGSQYESAGDKIYNPAMAISPQGEIIAVYRKLFPWRPIETTHRGDQFCVFDIPGKGRFGLAICYDQWFPEMLRTLAWMGAEAILHPTATTTSDRVLELTISQANAIFNQLYFLSVNGLAEGGNGRSIFVDPNGRVLQTAGEAETVLTEIIDLEHVRRTRRRGTIGLCHPLRELRDFPHTFPVYEKGVANGEVFKKMTKDEMSMSQPGYTGKVTKVS